MNQKRIHNALTACDLGYINHLLEVFQLPKDTTVDELSFALSAIFSN